MNGYMYTANCNYDCPNHIGGVMFSEWSDIFAAERCFSELACIIKISQVQSEHHLIDCYLFSWYRWTNCSPGVN